MQTYGAHFCLRLRMRTIWLDGVTDGDADDIFRLFVASAIEIDIGTCFSSYSSCCAGHAHTTHHDRVDGGCDGDADAGVRGDAHPRYPRCPRYYSGHRGAYGEIHYSDDLRPYLAPRVCLQSSAVDPASPHLQRQSAVALNGDDLGCSVHHLSRWGLIIVRHYHVDFEDVPVILRLP